MKKNIALSVLTVLFGCFIIISCDRGKTLKIRNFRFIYNVSISIPEESGKLLKLWVPLPQSNRYQAISNLNIESNYPASQHTEPVYGNRMAFISTKLPLQEEVRLTISFDVSRKERGSTPAVITDEEKRLFLSPTTKVPRDARFESIVKDILSPENSPLENARTLYRYILERMEYDKSGVGWGQGDAIYACDIGRGNCTDYHSLFNAVARTAGIPTRFRIGFPIPESEKGEIGGYHCWTEFYTPQEGWVPVDISEADRHPELENYLFGHLDPNRVLFTTGRDIQLVPPADGRLVNFFIYPVLEIDGVRTNEYRLNFSYHSLPE